MDTEVVLNGLSFPESPRWHEGALWFAEKRAGRVIRLAGEGPATAAEVVGGPGGIGWLPDGRMLVVSMADRTVLVVDPDGAASLHADLAEITTFRCNDMVVASDGRAWVGDFGYDLAAGASPEPASLVSIAADGSARRVAGDLGFPNGMVLTASGELVVAESSANRLTAFRIVEEGALTERRCWADLGETVPDGICLDAEGAIWVADPLHGEVARTFEGGAVSDRRTTANGGAFACALGGDDGRTLYVCTYTEEASMEADAPATGAIEVARVEVPSAETSPSQRP